jgi:hypothetical protein
MSWLLAAALGAAFVEIFIALPVLPEAGRLFSVVAKVQRTVRSPQISDHWKEKVLIVYAGRLLQRSLILSALLLGALAAVTLAGYAITLFLDKGFAVYMLSLEGSLVATLASLAYAFARFRLVPRFL